MSRGVRDDTDKLRAREIERAIRDEQLLALFNSTVDDTLAAVKETP